MNSTSSSPSSSFGDGAYLIGTEVAYGTYRNTGGNWCFVYKNNARTSFASGQEQQMITIDSGWQAITSKDCGTWTKVN